MNSLLPFSIARLIFFHVVVSSAYTISFWSVPLHKSKSVRKSSVLMCNWKNFLGSCVMDFFVHTRDLFPPSMCGEMNEIKNAA